MTDAPKALIFDLDGVLVDSVDAWFQTLKAVCRDLDVPELSEDAFRATFGQATEVDVSDFFQGKVTASELRTRYAGRFTEHFAGVPLLEPELPTWLDGWRRRGLGLAVATNSDRPIAHVMLDALGLTPRFDAIVTASDVATPKPAPDMVLEACSRLDVPPTDAWFIGDSPTDVAAGRAAGVRVVGFRNSAAEESIESLRGLV